MGSYKSGFIAIIGRSNVGKSTLMNEIIGNKVAIVSDRPQTTRNQIKGIFTTSDYQMVFMDTPGLHLPKTKLGKFMLQAVTDSLEEVDAVIVVIDASEYIGAGDMAAIEKLEYINTPAVLVLNKIDLIEKNALLSIIDRFKDNKHINNIIPISALTGDGIEELVDVLAGYLKEGPKFFDDDMITDRPEMFIVREIIREKALQNIKEEIPHGVGIEILRIQQTGPNMIEIHANIVCEKQSHKPIIIGKQGSMIKKLGTEARQDIEKLFANRVNLQLWVRVKPHWRDNIALMKDYGYDE
ncbi:MAG: GTPase Era [Clostridia bacterium]|nr:GTPase Era [Clostridia bacterium]